MSVLLHLSPRLRAIISSPRRVLGIAHASSSTALPVLTLYTKDPCSLCDQAKARLQPFQGQFHLQEVDITAPENAHWFELYRYEIPVFHFQDQFLCQNRIDTDLLKRALAQYAAQPNECQS
ncbi:hypothetical protein TCAL_00972 [Tigriopus californicus]|uniref:Glutaredoxin-like protein n=1 Tax=Tigriopus californicus TaxID=6832 RepID=A0A553P7U6_TIGCA|nr:hypothetical protein TCAL_00972 [Tigriopus californicus]